MEIINSIDNKYIKAYSRLKEKKYRDSDNMFLVEGIDLIEEAKKNDLLVSVITTKEYDFSNVLHVSDNVIKKLSSLNSATDYIGIVNKKQELEPFGRILILDEIQDPGNLGTIIRSSLAFNIDTIIMSNDCVDLYNEKVVRSTKGMLFNINIVRRSIIDEIDKLKNKGYHIIGTSLNANKSINDINFANNIALVVGNEGKGIKTEILNATTDNIKIDMNTKCESLNVGVATSILLYEIDKVIK